MRDEKIHPMPRDEGMTRLWVTVYAMQPQGWKFRGVVKGPRQADPVVRSPDCVAWARGPNDERAEGKADTAEGAMRDLANKLRAIRPDPNG